MSSIPDDELDTKALDAFLKALKNEGPVARVGIIGSSKPREQIDADSPTNAEIGAKHEFGLDGLPVRSFLRAPLIDKMQQYLDERGFFDPAMFKKVINESSFHELVAQVGIVGETVVVDAFGSGGFGKWPPSNMALKKNHQTLVETGQLRDAITSEVVDGD